MRKPVVITTPFPTLEETARILGVSRERRKWLEALVDEIQGGRPSSRAHPSVRLLPNQPKKKKRAVRARGAASKKKG